MSDENKFDNYIQNILNSYGKNDNQEKIEIYNDTNNTEAVNIQKKKEPFKFLDSYNIDDADIFFGREIEIEMLYRYVFGNKVTIIFGESGTGKTSLVQCGLFSKLEKEKILPIKIRFYSSPIDSTIRELEKYIKDETNNKTISEFTDKVAMRTKKTVILLFDQFEELFIIFNEDQRSKFVEQLKELINGDFDVRIIINIREEYFAYLSEIERIIPSFIKNKLWLKKLGATAAKEIIENPCKVCNIKIDDDLSDITLNEIGKEGKGVELPLIQVIMDALYKKAIFYDKNNPHIKSSYIKEVGGIKNILSNFIEDQIKDMGDETKQILKTMITSQGTKLPCSIQYIKNNSSHYGDEIEEQEIKNILSILIEKRIIIQDANSGLFELRHDILAAKIYEWMTGIEKELSEIRQMIDNRYNEYKKWKTLLDENSLNSISIYEDKLRLKGEKLEFLKTSKLAVDRKKVLKRRIITGITGAIFIALLFFTFLMWNEMRKTGKALKESYYNTSLALNEKAKAYQKENNLLLARLFSVGSAYYQAKASKYFIEDLPVNHRETIVKLAWSSSKHTSAVKSVQVTPDGKKIISGSSDGTIIIWNVDNGTEIKTLTGHTSIIYSLTITPDGKKIISGSRDNTIKIWDLDSGREIQTLTGHSDYVYSVAITPDGKKIISGSRDNTIKIWDLDSGREIQTLTGHSDYVYSVAITPDGKKIVSGSVDDTIKIWDIETGMELKTLTGHSWAIWSVAVTPDGKKIISGSADDTIKIWDIETGIELKTLTGHNSIVLSVAVTPDGEKIVSGSRNGVIKVWNMENGNEIQTIKEDSMSIESVIVTPDGQRIISGSEGNAIRCWNIENRKEISVISGHSDTINSLVITPDGKKIISGSSDMSIKIWDVEKNREIRTLTGHTSSISSVTVTPDGKSIISGSDDKTIRIWDIENGSEKNMITGHTGPVLTVAVTPDGKKIISGSSDMSIKIWDINNGKEIRTLTGHSGYIRSIVVTSDGKKIISGSRDNTVKIWDIESGNELKTLTGHSNSLWSVALTSDGKKLITASADTGIKIWDINSGKEIKTLSGHFDCVKSVTISPDGKKIISGSDDTTIRIWDIKTGKELKTLKINSYLVYAVTITPDGEKIISGSNDKTIKIWGANLLWLKYDYPYSEKDMESLLHQVEADCGYRLNGINIELIKEN